MLVSFIKDLKVYLDAVLVAWELLPRSICMLPDFLTVVVYALGRGTSLNIALKNSYHTDFFKKEEVTSWDGSSSFGVF